MNDLLFDSSVWINFFRSIACSQTDILYDALNADWPVWICPPIFQEVLQGVKHQSEWNKVIDTFSYLEKLEANSYILATEAAIVYRTLRQKGITIRKPNDCLIAAYAMRFNLQLVHNDSDFEKIALVYPIRIWGVMEK